MIISDRTKTSPRDTYLVNDLLVRNGDDWAELYKMGEKITNRPQLVKVQDLLLLPTGRAAKMRAREAISRMMPYVGTVMQMAAPQHSWSYDRRLLELFYNGDLDDEEEFTEVLMPENVDETDLQILDSRDRICAKDTGRDDAVEVVQVEADIQGDREEWLQESLATRPTALVKNHLPKRRSQLDRMLDNPSIQAHPPHHSQVRLGAVQDLSEVFNGMYGSQGFEHEGQDSRCSQQLSSRPRPSYTEYL